MDSALADLWTKMDYFCITFSKKEEFTDLSKFVNKVFSFTRIIGAEFRIGVVLFSIIAAKLDDLLETSKSLTEEAIQVIKEVNFEEVMNFSLKSGKENKFSNTVIYMVHVFAKRSRIRNSEKLYEEFIDRYIGWLKGVGDMVDFLKNEEISFEKYKKFRVVDFGAIMIIWMTLKVSKAFEKIENEEFKEFYDLLAENMWVSNDLNSLNKTKSEDISVYIRMIEFKGFSLDQIKEILTARLRQIEKDMRNSKKIDKRIRLILAECSKIGYVAHTEANRYNNFIQ